MAVALTKKSQMNITEGPLLGKMLRYAFPLICTNVLQLLYSSADMFVIGNYCSDKTAFGAIGCTGSLINLILGLLMGLGSGISVVLAHAIGSQNKNRISKTVHTTVLIAIFMGAAVGIIGIFISPALLRLMKTPDEFINGAILYVRIYFAGTIGNALFNFCSGLMRSRGDTVRPLIFSSLGGVINIILNLVLVICFDMGVEGVAVATIVSQAISALLSLVHLTRLRDDCRLYLNKLHVDKFIFVSLVKVGLPAGVQGMLFSISNMVLQSSYNLLGPLYVDANTAAMNVDGYIYNVLNAFYHVALTFASQNYGAKKYKRMLRVFWLNCLCVVSAGAILAVVSVVFSEFLIGIFNSDPAVIEVAKVRLGVMGISYFLCGLMETGTAMLRSIGHSGTSALISFLGSCVLRIIWVYTVFSMIGGVFTLYMVYPVTWIVTFVALTVAFVIGLRKEMARHSEISARE